MDNSENDNEKGDQFNTPYRGFENKQPHSTEIRNDEESHLKESEHSQEYRREEGEEQEQQETMESIEEEIKQIEKRLKHIKEQKTKYSEDSEEYQDLEIERKMLRKQLIDSDFNHRSLFLKFKKENQENERRRWEEQQKKIVEEIKQREQEKLERSRRLQEQIQQIEQQSLKRRQALLESMKRESPSRVRETAAESKVEGGAESQIKEDKKQEVEGESDVREEEPKQQQPKTLEEQAADARYKARVAEIELQLASQRLRRSRQIELESQLSRIRTLTPSLWYERYLLSYPPIYPSLYPLGRYPLYPSYYSPLYLSRYSYYPYI